MIKGRCRDYPANTFFPSDAVGVAIARRICARCSVKEVCLDYALANHIEYGIWGGSSERARQLMARQRRQLELSTV
jgi:WhiB family redox-sensing transcriptional regulator